MILLFSLFFGAGVAGFMYSKFSSRVGYGNTKQVAIIAGVTFVIATIVFYTFAKFVVHLD